MLYVDTPTSRELGDLNLVRSDACVSLYLPTTPITQDSGQSRIRLGNMVKAAMAQLETLGLNKRRIWPLQEQFEELLADDDFWSHQAHSLAILATPENIRTYRLANKLSEAVEVSDRFHLKPLLRAVTFAQAAYILAISENAVRLVEVSADLPAVSVKVPALPKDAASAVGKSTINDRTANSRIQGMEGQKVRLTQYIRKADAALRPLLIHSDLPVVLAATQPVEALVRSVSNIPFMADTILGSPDHLSEAELADAVRPVLDAHYRKQIGEFHQLFEQRASANRVTTDLSDAAKAATFGGIDTLLVDIDSVVDGYIDEETGIITFNKEADAKNYGIVDEIVGRAMRSGAKVLAVRRDDIPGRNDLAALLRYPL